MSLPAPFGKYELIEQIGSGGMADVFLARSFGVAGFEKRLVIKRIKPEHSRDPRFVSLFIHEAKIGVHLNHPNLVAVYELGKVGDTWYIAMEHLHGRDLNKVVRTARASDTRLPTEVSVRIAAEVARGLAFAHHSPGADRDRLTLVHRDVSPHNIFLTFAGEVKLVDFGVARLTDATGAERDEEDVPARPGGGKYAYMSPEQAAGRPLDHRTDLFSLGVVLWELLTGARMHEGSDPDDKLRRVREGVVPDARRRGADIDDALAAILDRALAPDPADRYDSAASMEEDLRAWLYEHHAPPGRAALATVMRSFFPEDSAHNPAAGDLRRLADDLRRLEDEESSSTSSDPGAQTGTTATPMPASLRAPDDERKRVVVLVVDVDGFTDISIHAEPEALFKRHLQMLRWLRSVADAHGGTIQHVHDDQAYLFFGIPRTRTDDLKRALDCAGDLQRRLPELRERGVTVQLAVGAHTGEVTLGRAGARVRYMARGDTTRLARRLSEQADHGQCLVSEDVFRAAGGSYTFHRGPWLLGRGGQSPLPSYVLAGRLAGTSDPGRGPWLARGDELERIRDALMDLGERRGSTVVLHGDDGSGKSRLVREFWEVARRRRIPVYVGQASAFGHPLGALRGVLLSVIGLDASAPDEAIAAHVSRFRQLGLYARDLEAIDALLGLVRAKVDAEDTWNAVRRVIKALAEADPVVVILEDVHHLAPRELERLSGMSARLADSAALLLLTARGAVPEALTGAAAVHLGPLPRPLQARLVASLLGAKGIGDALADLVARTCEGNPLYIEELVTYLRERQLVQIVDSVAMLPPDVRPSLPSSLAAILAARIDALDPASKGALQIAAVIGTEFSLALLGEVIGLDDPVPVVNDLAAHGLIRRADTTDAWTFASEFVRQAALRGILGVQTRDYHRLVAAALERRVGEGGDEYSEVLAEHCGLGGRPLDGARHAYAAGKRREDAQEFDAARECYRRGLVWIEAVDDSPDDHDARMQGETMLRLRLGAVSLLLGDVNAGLSSLRVALDVAEEHGLPWLELRGHLELGRHHVGTGDYAMARAHLGQAHTLARLERDRSLEVEVLEARAMLAHDDGTPEEAIRLWEDALQRAESDRQLRARCLVGLANVHLRGGDHETAEPLLQEALDLAAEAGDRILEGRVLNNLGLLAVWRDEPEEAVRLFRRALQVREDVGYLRGAVVNHHNIGDVHFMRGDLTRAYVAFRRSRELADEIGWSRGVALNEVYLGYIEGQRGQPGALERVRAAAEEARRFGDHEVAVSGAWLSGLLLAERGDREEAQAVLRNALSEARERRLGPLVPAIEQAVERTALGA